MGNGGFGGSLALKQPELKEFVPDLRQYLPQRRQFVPNRFYYN